MEILLEGTEIMLLHIFKSLKNVLLIHSSASVDAQLRTEDTANPIRTKQ